MDLESFDADQMPEDAWEQRNEFSDKLYELIKEFKKKQVNEDITLNSILIATLSFIYMETNDDITFMRFSEYYAKSLMHAAESWTEKE